MVTRAALELRAACAARTCLASFLLWVVATHARCAARAGQFVSRMWEDLSAAGMLKEPWQAKGDGDAAAAAADELNSKQQAAKPKRATGMVGERVRL